MPGTIRLRWGNIRFRREATGKPEFVHTNGPAWPPPRIFPAMVEQNQRADGSVVVPEVLRKYLGELRSLKRNRHANALALRKAGLGEAPTFTLADVGSRQHIAPRRGT